MTERLDWIQQIVSDPLTDPRSPGQLDLGLVAERVWDRCQCGGAISVGTDGDIAEAVARHIQGNRHTEWRLLGGLGLPSDAEKFGRVAVGGVP